MSLSFWLLTMHAAGCVLLTAVFLFRQGVNPLTIGLAVSAIVFAGTAWLLRRSSRAVFGAVLVTCIATYAGLYLLNDAMIYPDYSSGWIEEARKRGQFFDTRYRVEVIHDLRDQGIDAKHFIIPKWILSAVNDGKYDGENNILPLAGLPNVTTVYCNETGKYVVYDSDRYGFNNPDSMHEKPVDIMMVGDSMIHAGCIPDQLDVSSRLRRSGINTFNTGLANTGPVIQLATVREYGKYVKPKLLLWVFYEGDDFGGGHEESLHRLTRDYYLDANYSQDIVKNQKKINEFLTRYEARLVDEEERLSRYRHLAFGALRETVGMTSAGIVEKPRYDARNTGVPSDEEIATVRKVLIQAKKEARAIGAEIQILYLPLRTYFVDGKTNGRKETFALAKSLGIPIWNFSDELEKLSNPLSAFPFEIGGHFNTKGHDILAKYVRERIWGSFEKRLSGE